MVWAHTVSEEELRHYERLKENQRDLCTVGSGVRANDAEDAR